ncbi:DUF6421 family protein [Rhizohabitans arisaemae]|uniref:DUF6421 family protein n=1 Tax=Rhizohabitans arisaemae TaxID=2720610 RepID=UPI0024B0AD33|nr:DUF6421 family protein [Rhizohabitans arisaemae]
MRGFPRVLFDEAHCESWTIRREVATAINPTHPDDNSYVRAADILRRTGHRVASHVDGPFTPEVLADQDVLVIAHPADARWEKTTGVGSPILTAGELDVVEAYVRDGGGLVVLAECEQDKYGNNVAELLARFGIGVTHTTVQDPRHAHRGVATWVLGEPGSPRGLLADAGQACFYRAGALTGGDEVLFATSAEADPAGAALAVVARAGRGRVVAFADSDLFGDDSIADHRHGRLWENTVTWAARRPEPAVKGAVADLPEAWNDLKAAVEEIRPLQAKDGSIEGDTDKAAALVDRVVDATARLAPLFPHDAAYLEALLGDLRKWRENGFAKPDFLDSLLAFQPQRARVDGLEHLVVFPMYTQNGNPDRNLEAVWIRTVWPDWLAEVEAGRYDNPMFVPITFVDFTGGYDTNSAVLFPETVSVRETPPKFTWGAIFCDREGARFRTVAGAAAEILKLDLPPDAARLLSSQEIAEDTFALWDLIHDRTHSHGDLPFDPFMIKQRMPYWLYSLEELRCDLTAFGEAVVLEKEGVPHARYVQYAVLFDRLFRFPITGDRVRNYDGLGGQLLFAYLHRAGIVRWTDNRLTVDWPRVADGVAELRAAVERLYRDGIDRSKLAHWLAAYELVSDYVEPNPASVWNKGVEALPVDGFPKAVVDAVLSDEFPLSMFYEALRRKLGDVIESTRGITGQTA